MKKEVKLKCSECKTTYTEEISPNDTSTEAECPECGTYNYGVFKVPVIKEKKPSTKKESFKSGEKVKVQYIFNGKVSETATKTVHSIKKNIVYLKGTEGEKETGVYYNLDGSERDCAFYPQIYSKIIKIKKS
jgi:DNA-directed RNA polymerase subunit RPC12/RpoP